MKSIILVVEDEMRLSNAICKYLESEGYGYKQEACGAAAIDSAKKMQPDLIILDVMLPDMEGLAVCEAIRQFSTVPIIMLTARVQESDRLAGFSVGADDYVCKPFSPKELMYRVQAVLKRVSQVKEENFLSYEGITLILDGYRLVVAGDEVAVTQTEFQILHMLLSQPTTVFSREQLLTSAHGKYLEHYQRTIDSHIKNLRKKINMSDETNFIKTVYGVGYKFV